MADYAIGLSFHKAHRTLVRAVDNAPPTRYFATRDDAGFITLPDLGVGKSYIEIQGVRNASFQINDTDTGFRLLGDDGWNDSVITGSGVNANLTAMFLKDTEIPAGSTTPQFRGNYDEGFDLIQRSRYNKDYEVYFEFMKELGQVNGDSGDYIYDFAGFNAVLQNYQENINPEGLTEISFQLVSRGRAVFGRYNAGAGPLAFGGIQSGLLFIETGVREYAVSPLDNADTVAVGGDVTVTYTDGAVALTQLALGDSSGSGFRLENASSGVRVPCTVSLASNVVTINPNADLAAATIYRLVVADGAITQAVDGTGTASASGVKTAIQGFTSTFKTA